MSHVEVPRGDDVMDLSVADSIDSSLANESLFTVSSEDILNFGFFFFNF